MGDPIIIRTTDSKLPCVHLRSVSDKVCSIIVV